MHSIAINKKSGFMRPLFLAALAAGVLAATLASPADAQTAAAGTITALCGTHRARCFPTPRWWRITMARGRMFP